MKINSKTFAQFIDRLLCNKIMNSAILKTDTSGMTSNLIDSTSTILIKSLLDKSIFLEYEEGIEIPLGSTPKTSDLELLGKILKGFEGTVNVKVDKTTLIISDDNRVVNINLVDKDFVENKSDKEIKLEFDNGFEIDQKTINNVLSSISTVSDVGCVILKVSNQILEISIKGSNSQITEKKKIDYKDCEVHIATDKFVNVFKTIGKANISVIDNTQPILVVEKVDNMITKLIVAPLVEN